MDNSVALLDCYEAIEWETERIRRFKEVWESTNRYDITRDGLTLYTNTGSVHFDIK